MVGDGAPGGARASSPGGASPGLVMHHLTSVVNDPSDTAASLGDTLYDLVSSFSSLLGEPAAPEVPPLAPGTLAEVTPADFERYLRTLSASWPAFVAARQQFATAEHTHGGGEEEQPAGAWSRQGAGARSGACAGVGGAGLTPTPLLHRWSRGASKRHLRVLRDGAPPVEGACIRSGGPARVRGGWARRGVAYSHDARGRLCKTCPSCSSRPTLSLVTTTPLPPCAAPERCWHLKCVAPLPDRTLSPS